MNDRFVPDMIDVDALIETARTAGRGGLDGPQARALIECDDIAALMRAAARLRDEAHGPVMSYSRKVFVPLTKLCRDVCHYCTFAQPPRKAGAAYMAIDEVLALARAGAKAGCKEALFTLGDKPEKRYQAARDELARLGHDSTVSYLAEAARAVFEETGLLPHINAGVMSQEEIELLREVSVSQGIMLESISERLCEKGGPHYGSPDKHPRARLASIEAAGRARVPFTSGLLIGIGETRAERIESLLALKTLHEVHGHIQEIIIQPFRAKPGTLMANAPDAPNDELLWTCAAARLIFGPQMSIQAPPNLSPGEIAPLIGAGLNDWGGISPVTPDHVNPEAPWPHLDKLAEDLSARGRVLVERLGVYPGYIAARDLWLDEKFHKPVLRAIDGQGFVRAVRDDADWVPGAGRPVPEDMSVLLRSPARASAKSEIERIARAAADGKTPSQDEIARLFAARGPDFTAVCREADALRQKLRGDEVSYVVTRNVNYTNICSYRCQFCAFSKGKMSENLRGRPYTLELDDIVARASEAWARGATEICLQGGIHPSYTGETYLDICRALKQALPDLHIHAFSPLEIWQGAATLGLEVEAFLGQLKAAGLGSLPGTAAEILDDEVRAIICPDKITTEQWLRVMRGAHGVGLRSTVTIMFGHVDRYAHWARHLLRVLDLQRDTGGFTEFVPLPFVPMETPIYLKGRARKGPTFRESVLMHAIARLVFHDALPNIQASWVKMGADGLAACLDAGANDAGGTLMNEIITRSAGAVHGQEMTPRELEQLIEGAGRSPRLRTTLYATPPVERREAALAASPLQAVS